MLQDERPEHELHEHRASELLTLVALVFARTHGAPGEGALPCPVCREGIVAYKVTLRDERRRALSAHCSTAGCVRFATVR